MKQLEIWDDKVAFRTAEGGMYIAQVKTSIASSPKVLVTLDCSPIFSNAVCDKVLKLSERSGCLDNNLVVNVITRSLNSMIDTSKLVISPGDPEDAVSPPLYWRILVIIASFTKDPKLLDNATFAATAAIATTKFPPLYWDAKRCWPAVSRGGEELLVHGMTGYSLLRDVISPISWALDENGIAIAENDERFDSSSRVVLEMRVMNVDWTQQAIMKEDDDANDSGSVHLQAYMLHPAPNVDGLKDSSRIILKLAKNSGKVALQKVNELLTFVSPIR